MSTEVRTTTGVKHFISTSVWEGCRVHCRQRATYSGRQCVTGVWGEGHCQCYRIYCMQSPSSCAQEGIYYEPDLFCSRQMPQQVMLSFKCTCQVLRTFWLYSYQVAQKLVKARVSWHIFKIFFLAIWPKVWKWLIALLCGSPVAPQPPPQRLQNLSTLCSCFGPTSDLRLNWKKIFSIKDQN